MHIAKLTSIMIALGATLTYATFANAATKEECEAGIEEVNTEIGSKQGVVEGARAEAENLSGQATTANDRGDFDQCMELVEQAKAALSSN